MTTISPSFVHRSYLTRVLARPGVIGELTNELHALGCKKPLVLASSSGAQTPQFQGIRTQLAEFSPGYLTNVPRHSSLQVVSSAALQAAQIGADCFIAFGGGSVCDSAKAAAVELSEGGPLAQHSTKYVESVGFITPPCLKPKIPIISVVMTASGAEMTPSFGISDGLGHKLLFWDALVPSRVVLLDAAAGLSVPSSVMLASGMNGLAHCVEALYARNRSPISSILAAEGVKLFFDALTAVAETPGDMQARHRLLVAGHMGGTVLSTAGSGLHHAICHVLGSLTNLPHGDLNSAILPYAIEFNADCSRAALEPLCIFDCDPATSVRNLQERIGVPHRLRDLGVDRELLAQASPLVLRERGIANNPRPVVDAKLVFELLMRAW